MFGHRFDSGHLHLTGLLVRLFYFRRVRGGLSLPNYQVMMKDFHQVSGSIDALLVVQSAIEHAVEPLLFL